MIGLLMATYGACRHVVINEFRNHARDVAISVADASLQPLQERSKR